MIKGPSSDALIAQARAALTGGAHETALELLDRVVQVCPGYADVHNMRGICLAQQGLHSQAVHAFDAALAINAQYVDAHMNRAYSLRVLRRDAEANRAIDRAAACAEEQATDRYPPTLSALLANMHADLGDLYAEDGFLLEATEQYRRACEIRPEFVDIRNKLACSLMQLGIMAAAVRELRCALDIRPEYSAARDNLEFALRGGPPPRPSIEQGGSAAPAGPAGLRKGDVEA